MPLPASVCTAGEVACMDICEFFPQKCHLPAPTISVLYRYMLPSSGSAARQHSVDCWQRSCLMQRAAEPWDAC